MTQPDPADDAWLYAVAQDLLGRYSHGVDHGDLDLALDTFWPDATDHHGDIWNGNAHEYMREMSRRIETSRTDRPTSGPGFQHHVTTIVVRRAGADDAKVQAGFLAYVPNHVGSEPQLGLIVGRFLDHIQRREGVWKVLSRVVVNDFTAGNVATTGLPAGSWQEGGYVGGGYGPTDPGVSFLSGTSESAG